LNIAVAMDTTKNVKKRLSGAAKEREIKNKKLNEAAKTCQNITFFINNKTLKNQTHNDFDNNILTSYTVSLYFLRQQHLELFIIIYLHFHNILFIFNIHNCTCLLIITNRNMNMRQIKMKMYLTKKVIK